MGIKHTTYTKNKYTRKTDSVHIVSTLDKIITEIFRAKTLADARQIFNNHMNDSKINEADRDRMIREVNAFNNLQSLHRYLANALLKYEGLGVNTISGTSKVSQNNEDNAQDSAGK